MAIADPRLSTEAPTQETGTLPRIPEERRRAPRTMPRLSPGRYLAIEDGGEVVVIAVGEGSLRFGRGQASDVVLEDRSVSRRHAVLTRRGDAVVLWDDRSLNGVHVNGVRVTQAVLDNGDAITLGEVEMRFLAIG